MKLTMIAIGSRGDVQPIVALGRRLADAGYDVRIVTMVNFEPMVRGQGLEFFPVEGDAQALTNEMMLEGMKAKGLNLLSMYRGIMRTFGAITESYQQSFVDDGLRDSDAILSQLPGGLYGYDLAEWRCQVMRRQKETGRVIPSYPDNYETSCDQTSQRKAS